MGGSSKPQTTNTVAEPPYWQAPYMQDVLAQARQLYDSGGPSYYPGRTVAGFNPNLQGAVNAQQVGAGAAAGQALGAQQGVSDLYRAQDPLNNPFFASTAQAMIQPATQALTQQVLPGIQDQFAQAGQFGGSRQGVAEGRAIDSYQRNVLDTLTQFGTQAYGQGLDALGRGVALAPQTQAMLGVPGQMLGQAGDMQRTYEQQLIDANVERYNYNQQRPMEMLNWYAGLVGNPMGTTTTSVGPGQKSGGAMGALGGAVAGAGLASTLAGAKIGMFAGPPGIALGAGIGALIGLFA